MKLLTTKGWTDYELIDSGDGKRLERFGQYKLIRPDPQCIWKKSLPESEWSNYDAEFRKGSSDKGEWVNKTNMPNNWQIKYQDLTLECRLTPFKHTGIFPEQILHWEWLSEKIKNSGKEVNVLNLFAYTGASSLVAAKAGAKVTHVDASYPTIGWAKQNQQLSGLENAPIRWILDDAIKFVSREIKRGVNYDGIIMDPPIYGHGPEGEVWDFDKSFPKLVELCSQVLSDQPLFFIVNAYAISSSSIMLENILSDHLENLGGDIESGELALEQQSGRFLSTGIFTRWSR